MKGTSAKVKEAAARWMGRTTKRKGAATGGGGAAGLSKAKL